MLAYSPSRHPESTTALRSAQAASLALLRVVILSRHRAPNLRLTASIAAAPSEGATPLPENAGESSFSAPAAGTGYGGEEEEADSSGDVHNAVRGALLRRTPLLAGLVRCLVAATAAADTAVAGIGGGEAECAVIVVREACATLRCLLSSDVTTRLISGDGGCRSEIPQAIFVALGDVLGWGCRDEDVECDGGSSSPRDNGGGDVVRTCSMLGFKFVRVSLVRCGLEGRSWRVFLRLRALRFWRWLVASCAAMCGDLAGALACCSTCKLASRISQGTDLLSLPASAR